MKAVAIDDDPFSLKVIENFCRDVGFVKLEKTFEDPKAGLKYMNKFPVDLLFLDIDMPNLNGIDLYKKLKQSTLVIFTTARKDCAVEGFNLMAVDYLVKPFSFERFQQAARRASEFFNMHMQSGAEGGKYLFVRVDFSLMKIEISKIIYIEALDDYLKIHIEDHKTLVVRMTMKAMLEKLPANQFVRTHRSFIVPANRIQELRAKSVLIDKIDVPVSNNFMKYVMDIFRR